MSENKKAGIGYIQGSFDFHEDIAKQWAEAPANKVAMLIPKSVSTARKEAIERVRREGIFSLQSLSKK